jgi:predicted RecA/RadA family phage recombinase
MNLSGVNEIGDALSIIAPTGGLTSGTPKLIGRLFVVPESDAAAGAACAVKIGGVFPIAKNTSTAFAVGDPVYWDAGAGECVATQAGNAKIGACLVAAAEAAATMSVHVSPATADTGEMLDAEFAGTTTGALLRTGASAYIVRKDNLVATAAPAVGDDSDDGYAVGSLWIDVTGDAVYRAVDVTVGAAVWRKLSTVLAAIQVVIASGGTTGTVGSLPSAFNGKMCIANALAASTNPAVVLNASIAGGTLTVNCDTDPGVSTLKVGVLIIDATVG